MSGCALRFLNPSFAPPRTSAIQHHNSRRYFQALSRSRPTTHRHAHHHFVARHTPSHARLSHHAFAQTTTFPSQNPDQSEEEPEHPHPESASDNNLFAEHLNGVFPSLRFPPELAKRLLTHSSHKVAIQGHNTRFGFIGRRVLEAYLLLFLQSSPALQPSHDCDLIVARALNAHILGEHVAPKWGLGRIFRWAPPVSASRLVHTGFRDHKRNLALLRSVGLYKVHGEAVQAVMGGIFHQFGGSVAHRVFHIRVLPHILLPKRADGLLDAFHDDVLRVCERMGGPEGPLTAVRKDSNEPSAVSG